MVTAENGRIALDKLNDNGFDLVLLDLNMPEMDGWAPILDGCFNFVTELQDEVGNASVELLPDVGIYGNSHMLMMDKNNEEIANRLIEWIELNVE